jgi:hypothetical protein
MLGRAVNLYFITNTKIYQRGNPNIVGRWWESKNLFYMALLKIDWLIELWSHLIDVNQGIYFIWPYLKLICWLNYNYNSSWCDHFWSRSALLRVNRLQETPLFQNESNKDTNDLLMERGEKGFEIRPNPIIYTEVVQKICGYMRGNHGKV